MASRISYEFVIQTAYDLVEDLRSNELVIPSHQRDFCWSIMQQQKFLDTVLNGMPTASILLRQERGEQPTLEDGRQRLTTLLRFMENQICMENGQYYKDLSEHNQRHIQNYKINVTRYRNATTAQRVQIFDRYQNGVPLSMGERFHSMAAISPIVGFTQEILFTEGVGLHERASAVWGLQLNKDTKRKNLKNAVLLVAGCAFGPAAITGKWEEIQDKKILSEEFNRIQTTSRLETLISLYERVAMQEPLRGKAILNRQWSIGTFSAYILWSLWTYPIADHPRILTAWQRFLADSRRHPEKIKQVIHRDVKAARSWSERRWEMGALRVLDPAEADRRATRYGPPADGTESSDEDD